MIIINIKNKTFETNYKYIVEKNTITFYENLIDKNSFYTVIKYNKSKNKIYFIQDDIGDIKQYYYIIIEDLLIINTSIIPLLKRMKIKEFEEQSLYYFLSCGFIPNERTLIRGVYKVVPGYINIYNITRKKLKLKRKKLYGNSYIFNQSKYKKILTNNIIDNVDKNKKIGFTISSGYDSNLLISLYDKIDKEKKYYFSIGGRIGINEIPTAKKILKNYNVEKLYESYVNSQTLKEFPQIIYLYEGLFYERGIFLQYELYKLCLNKNINLILGEGADQILHLKSTKVNKMNDNIKKESFSLYKNCPLEMLSYIILKKSSLLLLKTNNNLIYPYLYNNFRKYNYNFRFLFGYDKKKHKNITKSEVNPSIRNLLNKIGGATEQSSLFKTEEEYNKIKEKALNSKFSKINCEHNTTELSLNDDYILKIIYLMIFEKIFIESDIYNDNYIKNLTLDKILNLNI